MFVTARKPAMLGAAALAAPLFILFVACEDTPATTDASAGTNSAGSGVSGSAAGGSVATGGVANTAGSGGAAAGTSSQAGTGGSSAGSGSAGGGAGGMAGGGAAGMSGGGGAAGMSGGSGGAGGAACGTLAKANDGSYVGSAFTAEYTCTGACPAKNGADQGDIDKNAFDDDYQSRWSTGVYQSALKNQGKFPLFFTVDLKQAVPVSKITTHPGCKDIFDSPGTFEVEVSLNGTDFTKVTSAPHTPVVPDNEACPPNASSKATDTITFPTACARYIRLTGTQRTTSDRYWAIGEMNIYP